MGCSSEMGCLGPRPRQREVYLDLIEAIYHEVDLLVLPSNEDIYEYIKTRLAKKGLLRKLTDNLKSHKSNVFECVSQNFQIISQSNLSQNRVASLIVVDKIMEELLKIHRSSEDSGIDRHSLELPLTSTSKQIGQTNRGSFDYMQLDPRIDNIFFKQIIFLLESQKQLQERIIHSVIQFCQHKEDKILNKTQVYVLFQYLYRKVNKKHGYFIVFQAFGLLLKRLKQNLKDQEKDQKYIKCFINIGSKQEPVNPQILMCCQQILQSYGSKYFSDYLIMYRSMVQLFDEHLFSNSRIWKIWEIMVKIAKNEDNYNNFVRGIFIYLLRYIMVHEELSAHSRLTYKLDEFDPKIVKNIYKEECKLSAFKMVTQWILNKFIDIDQTITYSSSLIVMTYITNYVYGSSEAFKEQLKKDFYRIIELLNVKSNEIIINLLIEEMKERETLNKKRKMLLVVIKQIILLKKLLASSQNTDLANLLMVVQPYYSTEVNLEVIYYMKYVLKSIKSEYVNGASYDSTNLRQKLCDFVFSIYSCIVSEDLTQQQSQAYIKANLFHKSRNLEDLNQAKAHILQKNKLCAELLGIIKILLQQHFYIIVVAFLQNINHAMSSLTDAANPEQAQILLFFVQLIKRHALFSINKRERLPEEMIKLHLKLQEGYISNSIRNQLIAFVAKLTRQYEQDFPQEQSDHFEETSSLRGQISALTRSDTRRIAAAKEFYMFNQLQYGQVMQCFKLHFRLSSATTKKEAWQTTSQIKFFHRNSSINMSRQEFDKEQESVRNEADESFRDIITKINER